MEKQRNKKYGRPGKMPDEATLAELYKAYEEEGLTSAQIAEKYGVSSSTVRSWMCRYRRASGQVPFPEAVHDLLKKMAGNNFVSIDRHCGRDDCLQAVEKLMAEYGYKLK